MKIDSPVTILSDLHVGHPASKVKDVAELAPLFRDAATVVFNGDTCEMLWLCNRDHARSQLDALAAGCLAAGARPVFLNGNHDPIASSASYLDLAHGEVLVTHGDLLFHEIAPWSHEAEVLGPEHLRILEGMSDDEREDLAHRLVAVKKTSLALEMHEPKRPGGRLAALRTAFREGWPPWRALSILRCWIQTPGRADELATRFRPRARYVLIGHTHYAGVWQRGQRVIINTGSFLPFSGCSAVLLDHARLEVRKVVRGRNTWEFGRVLARFPLAGCLEEAKPARPHADQR